MFNKKIESGSKKVLDCPICKTKCKVKRNIKNKPITSYAAAILRSNWPDIYDEFWCQYNENSWHQTAYKIYTEMMHTNSPTLKQILQSDINDILKKEL